ncbi:MAG: PEGA domain-containing protein [Bryobacteraceae bacterium]
MRTPFVFLISLAALGSAPAQEPPSMILPPTHLTSGRLTPAAASTDPVSLYRSRNEAAAAAFQAAYRAATVERNRFRAIRLFLVALRRDPQNPPALFNMAVLCEQEDRWGDALSFLGEARKLAAPGSETALAVAAETPRAEAIEQLQRTREGRTRRQYDAALMAALPRSKDPFAGLAAVAQLVKIDQTRWEAPALAGTLHAQTGQFTESVRDLEEAARLAGPARAPGLKSAAEVASREAGYLERARAADPLWEAHQWEQAAKAYEQAWEKSPRHTDAAVLAVTGYLMIDQVDPAVRLLVSLRKTAPAADAKAVAILKELAAVSEAAGKAAAGPAPPPVAAEPDPPTRIGELAGPLTDAAMELEGKPAPNLLADRTSVIPLPDADLDAGDSSWTVLSNESLFQRFTSGIAPPPPPPPAADATAETPPAIPDGAASAAPVAASPADNPPDADSAAIRGDRTSIQSDPPGALVVVDGAVKCTAPCLIALAPGRHTLKAQLARHRDTLKIFEVAKNSPSSSVLVTLEAQEGFLDVVSDPPGALVFLDGQPTGQRTPGRFRLPAGEHDVGIEVDGKIRTGKAAVTDGGETALRF